MTMPNADILCIKPAATKQINRHDFCFGYLGPDCACLV